MLTYDSLHIAIICLSNDIFVPPGAGWFGGGQLGAYENGRYLVSQGARVTYILRSSQINQKQRELLGPRCTILRIPETAPGSGKPNERGMDMPSMIKAGLELLLNEPHLPNIIHSQYWIGGALGHAISQKHAIRHIHFFLSLGRLTYPPSGELSLQQTTRDQWELEIYRYANCLVAQSFYLANKFKKLYPEITHEKVSVIHHGVDHLLFTRRPESTSDYFRRSSSRFSQGFDQLVGSHEPS
ncbi:MAG: glycosyltransferase [Magnetococcales bacterium]|nr:glycosyltransferase [Magnetococcales bacterium]